MAPAEECLANPVGMSRYSMDASSTAFSHRGSLTHSSSQYYKRLNSGDSHLGGGPPATTGGSRTNAVPLGGPSTPGLRFPASSPKRSDVEGDRCGNVTHALASYGLMASTLAMETQLGAGGIILQRFEQSLLGKQDFP